MNSLPNNWDAPGEERVPRRLMRQLFEQAPDALLLVNAKGKIIMINSRAEQLFGYQPQQLVGHSPLELLPAWLKCLSKCEQPIDENTPGGTGKISNMLALRSHGDEFCAEVSLRNIAQGNNRYTVASIREKTPNSIALVALEAINKKLKVSTAIALDELETINKRLKISNANLVNLSMTDPLTELLNRRGLESVLQREISYSKRYGTELAVALVDLDDFKSINDENGHAYGDLVLRDVAKILKDGLRSIDWLGRVGGDEFLILLPCTGLAVAVKVAERARLALSHTKTRTISGGTVTLTASFGMVTLPSYIHTIDEVLELTTATLKESKQKGKNQVSFGDVDESFGDVDGSTLS